MWATSVTSGNQIKDKDSGALSELKRAGYGVNNSSGGVKAR